MPDVTLPAELRETALHEITAKLAGIAKIKCVEPVPEILIKAMAKCRLREVIRISFPNTEELMPDLSSAAAETGLTYAYEELINDYRDCWENRHIAAATTYGISRETAIRIRTHLCKQTFGS